MPIEPLPPAVEIDPSADEVAWATAVLARQRQVHQILERSESVPIDLPYAGAHFLDCSPGDCVTTLQMLADAGYHVAGGVIEDLRAEQAGMDGAGVVS